MKYLKIAAVYALLVCGGIVLLLPFLWMVTVSLATAGQSQRALAGVEAFVEVSNEVYTSPKWDNYSEALRNMGAARAAEETLVSRLDTEEKNVETETGSDYDPLWKALWTGKMDGAWEGFFNSLANTVVITTLGVVGLILSCSLVGYSFARVRFRGSRVLFIVMLATMMLPGQVTMIPVFILYRNLGWVNTILPLTVPAFFGSAFFIFMYRQFFSQIPQDLIDSARIDGAGYLGIWWRIMLPMCRPVVAITAIFTFMGSWNDFMGPLIYLHSPEKGTLALALNSFRTQFGGVEKANLLMAGSIMTMIPCVVLFFAAQRHFIKGLNLGAVKG